MATVRLDHIVKRYPNGVAAVDDVSFAVEDGEFVSLLGPSGCGKSTTLRMIAGLESISAGTLFIDGKEMNAVPAKDRDIAMVFQSYALYPHMNIADNLAFGLRRRGVAKDEQRRRVGEAARILGLSELLGRKPHALSGGQRQRVALGRAIVRDPKVFLFDEPLSNLDAALRSSMRGEIVRQHQRLGTTMIYVTHDQVEAMTMSTRMCIMNAGRLVQTGKPMEIYRNPANTFVARFLGSPPMNLVPARLEATGETVAAVLDAQRVALPGQPPPAVSGWIGREVQVGIRPEHVFEPHKAPAEARTTLHGDVRSVEPLGAETILTCGLAGGEIAARISGESAARPGNRIELCFDPKSVHLFSSETGEAIPWPK
jgi:multiple sugar transport system ATP-binding protein